MEFDADILRRGTGDLLLDLRPSQIRSATARSANRTATGTRTEISKRIRRRANLRSKTVKDAVSIKRATNAKPEATVTVKYEPIPLKEYGARQRKKGVSVRVLKKTSRTIITSAFIVDTIGKNVMMRHGRGVSRVPRLPIDKRWGPSIRSQAEAELPGLEREYIRPTFEKRLAEQVSFAVQRARRRPLKRRR